MTELEPIVMFVDALSIEEAAYAAREKMRQCAGVIEVGARLEHPMRGFLAFKNVRDMRAMIAQG